MSTSDSPLRLLVAVYLYIRIYIYSEILFVKRGFFLLPVFKCALKSVVLSHCFFDFKSISKPSATVWSFSRRQSRLICRCFVRTSEFSLCRFRNTLYFVEPLRCIEKNENTKRFVQKTSVVGFSPVFEYIYRARSFLFLTSRHSSDY